eukprot:1896443-Pleurochrysis_carterae.AAC.2
MWPPPRRCRWWGQRAARSAWRPRGQAPSPRRSRSSRPSRERAPRRGASRPARPCGPARGSRRAARTTAASSLRGEREATSLRTCVRAWVRGCV